MKPRLAGSATRTTIYDPSYDRAPQTSATSLALSVYVMASIVAHASLVTYSPLPVCRNPTSAAPFRFVHHLSRVVSIGPTPATTTLPGAGCLGVFCDWGVVMVGISSSAVASSRLGGNVSVINGTSVGILRAPPPSSSIMAAIAGNGDLCIIVGASAGIRSPKVAIAAAISVLPSISGGALAVGLNHSVSG